MQINENYASCVSKTHERASGIAPLINPINLFTPLFRILIVLSRSAVIYQALNVPPVFTISARICQSHLRSSTPCHDCQLFYLRKTRGPIDISFHFWFRISCYLIGIDDWTHTTRTLLVVCLRSSKLIRKQEIRNEVKWSITNFIQKK